MTFEELRAVPAIDFHSHFGPVNCDPADYAPAPFENLTAENLLRSMRLANIAVSINSHNFAIMPRGGGDVLRGNEMLMESIASMKGVYGWAVVNPLLPESFSQARELLKDPKILGIKVHPEEHLYPIREHGEKIYEFAAEVGCTIITHSGEANSLPEDFCVFANRYPTVKTICSHLGCGYDGSYEHQLIAIERNTADNLYTDTSSARSVMGNLLEYAVGRVGSEKILFGTDSGYYFSPCQRVRVDGAAISDDDKLNILCRNALRIFPFLREIYEKETSSEA